MDYIKISDTDILNASTYIPIMEKVEIVNYCAERCFDKMEMNLQDGDAKTPMPAMYKENPTLKARYLMGVLAKRYLGRNYEPVKDDEWLMSADDYDRYAGGHIFNQIERVKQKGGELRDKAFDIVQDFKDLEKRLNTEIYGMLQVMNDPCSRLYAMVAMQTTPESFMKNTEELKKLKEELDKAIAAKQK